jgi:hypothetical protein
LTFRGKYPFAELETGIYFFTTDSGQFYRTEIYCSSLLINAGTLLFNDGNVFEISFYRATDEKIFDASISETILFIIIANITAKSKSSIFYFICDTSGEKGKQRARLFNIWFLKIEKYIPSLVKVDFQIPGFDGEEFDISLLIHNTHPQMNEFIKEFGKRLDDNFDKNRDF